MRLAAGFALGFGLFGLLGFAASAPARAEYYCSVGFEPTSGGRCIAVAARDEIQLYLNDPTLGDETVVRRRHHRRHGLRSRY